MRTLTLVDAVVEALFEEFGSGYEIYTEKVEQGLQEPCFLVRCLDPTKNLHIGRCYLRTNQFSIQYIPSTATTHEECMMVLERLFECLEYLTVNDKLIRGTNLNGQITDGILTFLVNYDGFVLKETEAAEDMESLQIETEAKG